MNLLTMDRLIIPKHILEVMFSHCRAGSPNEACGILAGMGNEVSKIYPMDNSEKSPVSYLMNSQEQFRVMKDIRENRLEMVAIFHSHPSSPPYPSPKDVSLAFYEDSAYVIVGLTEREPVIKAFSVRAGKVQEIEIMVKGAS
jgi:proteasome lid subunit RPN8/RPN11